MATQDAPMFDTEDAKTRPRSSSGPPPVHPDQVNAHLRQIIANDPHLMAYIDSVERERNAATRERDEAIRAVDDARHSAEEARNDAFIADARLDAVNQASANIAGALDAGFQNMMHNLPKPAAAPADIMATPKPTEPRLAMPDRFDGRNPSQCRDFLAQCLVYFEGKPSSFQTDQSKISFTISLLHDLPLQLVIPELSKDFDIRPLWLRSWLEFSQHLVHNFGQVDEALVAKNRLRTLVQTTSVSRYWVNFKALALHTGWNDEALQDQFRRGLRGSVKDGLVNHDKPDSLDGLKDLAIKVDQRIFERDQEKRRDTGRSPFVKWTPRPAYSDNKGEPAPSSGTTRPVPMELDAVHTRSPPPKKVFRSLTPEQREFRRLNNLCAYCGEKHSLENCTKKPAFNRQATFRSNYTPGASGPPHKDQPASMFGFNVQPLPLDEDITSDSENYYA